MVLRVVIGQQEFRFDLTLNYWGIGVDLPETDNWPNHLGPLDIECEYDNFHYGDGQSGGQANSKRSRRHAKDASSAQQRRPRRMLLQRSLLIGLCGEDE